MYLYRPSFDITGCSLAVSLLWEVGFDHIHGHLGLIDFQIRLFSPPIDPNSYILMRLREQGEVTTLRCFPQRWKTTTCHRLDVD